MTIKFYPTLALIIIVLLSYTDPISAKSNVVKDHGNLSIKGAQVVDQQGKVIALAGPSFFWSNTGWGGDAFYRPSLVKYFTDEWQATWVRAAIGIDGPGSLLKDKTNMQRLKTLIDAAIANGVYVVVDFHSHHAEDHQAESIAFFEEIATQYGHLPNIIYEIYNEPLGITDWKTVIKPYSETVIAAIRKIDSDNIIVVGSQTWSQDVDKAADDPVKGFNNIAYSLHFYAGTHKQDLRDKAQYAIDKGFAIMVTEWGTVDANGAGKVDKEESNRWQAFMLKNHLSQANWSVTNKNESSAIFKPKMEKKTDLTDDDLTESGLFVKNIIKNWPIE